jgi:hypothetical protein
MLFRTAATANRSCCFSAFSAHKICCSPVLYVSSTFCPTSRSRPPCLYGPATRAKSPTSLAAWSLLLPEAAQAAAATIQAEIAAHSTGELSLMNTGAIWWPLLLSTLAGLSTAIGGLIAVSFAPSEGTLAFLLGTGQALHQQRVAVHLCYTDHA